MSVRGRVVCVSLCMCVCIYVCARVERVKSGKRRNGRERKRGRKNGARVKGDLREGTCFAIERVAVVAVAVARIIGNVISYTIRYRQRQNYVCTRTYLMPSYRFESGRDDAPAASLKVMDRTKRVHFPRFLTKLIYGMHMTRFFPAREKLLQYRNGSVYVCVCRRVRDVTLLSWLRNQPEI